MSEWSWSIMGMADGHVAMGILKMALALHPTAVSSSSDAFSLSWLPWEGVKRSRRCAPPPAARGGVLWPKTTWQYTCGQKMGSMMMMM